MQEAGAILGFRFLLPNSVQVVAHILEVSPFSTFDSRLPQEGGEFQIRLARLWISDCLYPGRTAHCRLLTAYCLLPTALFGILGAAEVMRVFQSEFFDASQKYDELSALASCWLWVVS
jgi:hypothetical protein